MKWKGDLTPIPENWHHLEKLHYQAIEKHGPDAGFDSGYFHMSEEHSLSIGVSEGYEIRKGRKGKRVRHTNLRYHLAMFCPFTGLPLYEESQIKQSSMNQKPGVQASLF